VEDQVDEVVSDECVGEYVAFEGGEQQVDWRVVRRVELRRSEGVGAV
jgi:hypothetical protein